MIRSTTLRLSTTLMVSASALSLAAPAMAQEMLFASNGDTEVRTGQRQTQTQGLTQIRLQNGATVSILDRADYRINADGTVDLYGGSITVAGGNGMVIVRMPEGVTGEVEGEGSAASFSVADNGEGRGHILTGAARLGRGDTMRRFTAGEMFAFAPGERVRQVVSNGAQATPDGDADEPQVADLGDGGPVAAAQNGLPVTLGDALAAAGASSDIVEAARRVDAGFANPSADTFPSGDLGLLIAGAAGLESAYGGTPFTGAQADIIRTYLTFLANGGAGSQFLASYAGFLGDYLDLIRSGAAPSGFDPVSLAEINSFITFSGRTSGFVGLAASDRVLVEAYLAFLLGGGNPDLFAGTFTDLTTAYFAFVRGGGNPADFTGGSQATLDDYIAFLADSGLIQQLSAENRALVAAYLANGGLAFTGQYQAAFSAYSDYLASGGLPSAYGALDQATLRAYLETLAETGLLAAITGARANFYADYLAFLRAGGDVDGFAGLPVNIFTGYAGELDAYFAFLAAGNLPSDYSGGDIAELQAFVSQLQAAGALEAFLGNQASFFAAFNAFLAVGGDFDAFGQLNANIFAGYALSLDAYFAFLNGGGLPSAYTEEQLDVLNAYLAQLAAAGALERFLGGQADFFADYLAFLQGGGQIDSFALLNANIFAGYASALSAYYDYLANGGVPSAYGVLSQEVIADYLAALAGVGATDTFLADLADFYSDYFAFILGGGNPDNFAGLPVPPDFPAFASALNAYALFLSGGGLPSDYTAEELAVLQQYLDVIVNSGQLTGLLGGNADLLTAYFAFIANGGDLDGFTGLPVYADYVSALNAYYAFLAGGGLPGDYTALTQAQIEAYLAALNGAGGFGAYGDLNTFFTAYFAFVSGGGDPAQFAGLPVYADYVAALNGYYAFLAGGGLPSDYTVLTQAQIEAYLAALSGVQGGFASFGGLNDFFTAYFAFISGGGDPADYAALPVYNDYLAAITAFYNFLAAGNVPSDYTALTEAQIEAYLDALARLGLLASEYDGAVLAFFQNYLAFLAGGGFGDNFAGGFPTTPIGGGLIYAGGYTDQGTGYFIRGAASFTNTNGPQIAAINERIVGPSPYRAVLSSTGALERLVSPAPGGGTYDIFRRGSAQTFDVFGDANILIGRWSDGNYFQRGSSAAQELSYNLGPNQGFHYLLANGHLGPAAYPSGKVFFDLLAATQPTLLDGSLAPGVFEAEMALTFGASPLIAYEGTITFAGQNGFVYSFATPGGVDGAGAPIFISSPSGTRGGGYFNHNVTGSSNDGRTGLFEFDAQIVDAAASRFGITYTASLADSFGLNFDLIQGAAIFGQASGQGGGGNGGGGTGGGTGGGGVIGNFDTAGSNTFTAQSYILPVAGLQLRVQQLAPYFGGTNQGVTPNRAVLDTNGGLERVESRTNAGVAGPVIERRTAQNLEIAGDEYLVIGRWSDGSILSNVAAGNTVGPNQALHYMLARGLDAPVAVAPGLIRYTLVHATSPTLGSGRAAPGTFNANLAIQYGAAPLLGIDGTIVFEGANGFTYTFATNGGADAPSKAIAFADPDIRGRGGHFSFTTDTGSADNGLVGNLVGFGSLGRADGSDIGLAYTVDLTAPGVVIGETIAGAAIFRSGNSGTGGSDFTGTRPGVLNYLARTGNGLGNAFGGTATLRDGDLVRLEMSPTAFFDIGTATVAESGDLGEIAWARWTGGNVTERSGPFTVPTSLGANGGWHVLAGDRATNLPTSGTVTYQLLHTTPVTELNGPETGTLTGNLAVQFGAQSTVGFDFRMDYRGRSWSVTTPGGASNPGAGIALTSSVLDDGFDAVFSSDAGNVTGTGGACVGYCEVQVEGVLFGVGGRYAGIGVGVEDRGSADGTIKASALAIFGAESSYTYNPYAVVQPSSAPIAMAPASAGSWERWSVPASGQTVAPAFIGNGGGSITPAGYAPTARDAERMLGGMITFPEAR